MAGQDLYIGKIFADLAGKLERQLIELQNINTTASQGVTEMKISKSNNIAKTLEKPVFTLTNTLADTKLCSLTSFSKGTMNLKLKGTKYTNYGLTVGYLKYALNGGAITQLHQFTIATQGVQENYDLEVTLPFSLNVNDVIDVYLSTVTSAGKIMTITVDQNGLSLCYDIVDIVNQKGIVLV